LMYNKCSLVDSVNKELIKILSNSWNKCLTFISICGIISVL
jgi:hypothetical protein